MVACLVRDQEAVGSNPATPTIQTSCNRRATEKARESLALFYYSAYKQSVLIISVSGTARNSNARTRRLIRLLAKPSLCSLRIPPLRPRRDLLSQVSNVISVGGTVRNSNARTRRLTRLLAKPSRCSLRIPPLRLKN